MAHRIVGIDFGHGVVRGAEVADPGTARQRVLRTGSAPLPEEAVVSGEVRDVGDVSTALRQLWSSAGFTSKRVVLGLGNSRVLARDLSLPVRPIPQLRESLPFLVADVLPMPLENAVLDYYPVSSAPDEDGVDMYQGILVAALKDVALGNAKAVQRAGLEPTGIDLIPFALVRSLADAGGDETRAYVHVGASTTIIAIATGAVPEFVRMVPLGGEEFTRSLMDLGQFDHAQAEELKRSVGLIADEVEARHGPVVERLGTSSAEVMKAVRDTVQYFVDTRQRDVVRIVLSGGGAELSGFAPMLAAWTRLPVEAAEIHGSPEFFIATALASSAPIPSARRPLVGSRR